MAERTIDIQVMLSIVGLDKRLDLLEALAEGEKSNAELVQQSSAPLGVWGHLQQLTEVGLITKIVYSSRSVFYRINPDAIEKLAAYFGGLLRVSTEEVHDDPA